MRLLESVEPDEAPGGAAYDRLQADPSRAIPARGCSRTFRSEVGRPFLTGRVHYTPEATQQLDDLDEWITTNGSADVARSVVSALMEKCESIPVFPRAGRVRDDVRPGMRRTTFRKRTMVACEIDEASGEAVINILGVFHGGQDWENALRSDPADTDDS